MFSSLSFVCLFEKVFLGKRFLLTDLIILFLDFWEKFSNWEMFWHRSGVLLKFDLMMVA
jgi:hypothetical protein